LLPADVVVEEANDDSLAEPLLTEEAALMHRASPERWQDHCSSWTDHNGGVRQAKLTIMMEVVAAPGVRCLS
jgi:hypothetical protein